jgi:hypothetical protein
MAAPCFAKSVQPHSQAARPGVLPRDSFQFASLYHTDFDDTEYFGMSRVLDESATSFALACEARGMRISYDELRRPLLADKRLGSHAIGIFVATDQ